MTKKLKKPALVLLLIIAVAFFVTYKMWNKERRDVTDEKGVEITAVQLVKEFQDNEAEANKKYLDKAMQVSGSIAKIEKNQEGNITVLLASDDAFAGVFCTLKENSLNLKDSSRVVIKGLCSGMLSDVRLREAIVVK